MKQRGNYEEDIVNLAAKWGYNASKSAKDNIAFLKSRFKDTIAGTFMMDISWEIRPDKVQVDEHDWLSWEEFVETVDSLTGDQQLTFF